MPSLESATDFTTVDFALATAGVFGVELDIFAVDTLVVAFLVVVEAGVTGIGSAWVIMFSLLIVGVLDHCQLPLKSLAHVSPGCAVLYEIIVTSAPVLFFKTTLPPLLERAIEVSLEVTTKKPKGLIISVAKNVCL